MSKRTEELIGLDFGFSCLPEPKAPRDPGTDDRGIREMLEDWGWTGAGSPPAWMAP